MIGNNSISVNTGFYQSEEWQATRQKIITERLVNGETICEYCHKPIYKKYDIILHHKIELNELNYQDANISLNPDNIMIVHHSCHNKIHNNFGKKCSSCYIVYGPPMAGKSTYVKEHMQYGDIIVDIDKIWECITGINHLQGKPEGLKRNVFAIRDLLYDQIRHKVGFYKNCYIVGGFPLISERERLARDFNAEVLFIDTDKETCMSRAKEIEDKEVKKNYITYIENWFDKAKLFDNRK